MAAKTAWTIEYSDCISAEGWYPFTNDECPTYGIKQSDVETPVMQSVASLPWLPGPLKAGVVVPDSVLSVGPIERLVI